MSFCLFMEHDFFLHSEKWNLFFNSHPSSTSSFSCYSVLIYLAGIYILQKKSKNNSYGRIKMYNWLWVIFSSSATFFFHSSTHIPRAFVLREMYTLLVYVMMLQPFILACWGYWNEVENICIFSFFSRCCCLRNKMREKNKNRCLPINLNEGGVEKFILTFLAIYSRKGKTAAEAQVIEERWGLGIIEKLQKIWCKGV